jgi:hypothetical protein
LIFPLIAFGKDVSYQDEAIEDLSDVFLVDSKNVVLRNPKRVTIEGGDRIRVFGGEDITVATGKNITIDGAKRVKVGTGNRIEMSDKEKAKKCTFVREKKDRDPNCPADDISLENVEKLTVKGAGELNVSKSRDVKILTVANANIFETTNVEVDNAAALHFKDSSNIKVWQCAKVKAFNSNDLTIERTTFGTIEASEGIKVVNQVMNMKVSDSKEVIVLQGGFQFKVKNCESVVLGKNSRSCTVSDSTDVTVGGSSHKIRDCEEVKIEASARGIKERNVERGEEGAGSFDVEFLPFDVLE